MVAVDLLVPQIAEVFAATNPELGRSAKAEENGDGYASARVKTIVGTPRRQNDCWHP
jgi:hypothetical protein